MKVVKSWTEIKLQDISLKEFELEVPMVLVKQKKLERNEKHAAILAYSILNYLDRFSKIVTEKDLVTIKDKNVNNFVLTKEVYKHDTALHKSFFMKFLTKLGVSPLSRYKILNTLVNSHFVSRYNEETGMIYLKGKKEFYFPFESDRPNHTFRLIVSNIDEIKKFAKPRYIGAFLVRFLYSEPYITKKDNSEVKPYTYEQICKILGVTTQSIRTALKISKEFRIYKFIEVSNNEYYMNKSFSDRIDGRPTGFYTKIKVYNQDYINEESKRIIVGPKYFKNKDSVDNKLSKFTYRYFKLEGMRLLCNYEVTSVRLNKRRFVKVKSKNKYIKKKALKLKVYDSISPMKHQKIRFTKPDIFKVTSESSYNSLYTLYNEEINTLSINIFATNLKEAIKKLKLFAKLSSSRRIINVIHKFVKFSKKSFIDMKKYSINFYRKVIRKESSEITFNTAKDGIMSATKKALKILNEFYDKQLFTSNILFDISNTLVTDFVTIKGTTIKNT